MRLARASKGSARLSVGVKSDTLFPTTHATWITLQLDAIERKRVLHLAAHHAPRPQQHVAAQVCPTPEDAALADHARTADERT